MAMFVELVKLQTIRKPRRARRLRLVAVLGLRPAALTSSRLPSASPLSVPPTAGWTS